MGSECEEEDEDDDPIRPPLNLGHMGSNGPESVGHLGASDLSVQSMSTDSKNNDDSDQVREFKALAKRFFNDDMSLTRRVQSMAMPTREGIHSLRTKVPRTAEAQSDGDRAQQSKPNN